MKQKKYKYNTICKKKDQGKAKSVVNKMGFYGIRQLNDIKVFQAEDAQQILTNALPQWA